MITPRQKHVFLLLCVFACAFFTRTYRLHLPEGYIFDEVYHALTSKLIARNDPRAFEWWNQPVEPNTAVDWLHPPLAKYTQALSIRAFGENSFGWRFSSVVFGMITLVAIYKLTAHLTGSRSMALLATFLTSLDGLVLVQSRIAMNDIHVTAVILCTFIVFTLYRKRQKFSLLFATGILAGVAMGTKWSGVFTLGVIWLYEVLMYLRFELTHQSPLIERASRSFFFLLTRALVLLLVPLCVYVASYSVMFAQGKDLQHFIDLHKQIWWYQTHLEATHPYQSRPYEWFLNIRPVWMSVEYLGDKRGDIYAFGNPALFLLGGVAAVSSLGVGIYTVTETLLSFFKMKRRSLRTLCVELMNGVLESPVVFLLVSYSAVWMPWQFSPRIMFFYHYTPAVPLMAALLAYWLVSFWKQSKIQTAAVVLCVSAIVVCFAVWYPHWIGMPVSTSFAESVYFVFDRWK